MRIISGKYGGRKLVSFHAEHIRPTTDRVKESVFNKLMAHWEGARVLDLFAGTGNLSIEALSWGATSVESVELNVKSIEIMKKNIELLKIGPECKIVKSDVLKYLSSYSGDGFDVILADPPFTEKMAHAVMTQVSTSKVWKDSTIIMIEYSKFERLDSLYPPLKGFDTKNFGDKLVSFFSKGE
jgi:16S rRNA (guanine966-N2)-methyltransferase